MLMGIYLQGIGKILSIIVYITFQIIITFPSLVQIGMDLSIKSGRIICKATQNIEIVEF